MDKSVYKNQIRAVNKDDEFDQDLWSSNAAKKNWKTKIGDNTLFGGVDVGGRAVYFQRVFKLPEHKRVTIEFKAYTIDSWEREWF